VHSNVYLSLSTTLNARSRAHEALVRACDPTRILVESDYPDVRYCAPNSWDMLLIIAKLKDWWVEENEDDIAREERDGKGKGAVRRIKENWEAFVRGNHVRTSPRQSGKIRKQNNSPHAEEDWVSDEDEVILPRT
jgi:Tat protein secretion system quality control protein TatD with DNase activity